MSSKKRLDILLVEHGIASSREKAKSMIMSGDVYVDGVREDKAGSSFPDDVEIEYRGEKLRYVSRGGLKLEKAVAVFGLMLDGRICMDIGASTGGFTDCMLQNGAAKVYSIDVGYGQLAWSLRNDERVVCMEKTNFRYLTRDDIPDTPDFASVDVSFISLSKILPAAADILSDDGEMVCLIKPQFEAGRELVGKKGVVREPSVHENVIRPCLKYAEDNGFQILGLDFSPIKGPEGNIEYLMHIKKGEVESNFAKYIDVPAVVSKAHDELASNVIK
ncbi:MAG: TlyA family RNA methyltransferase [Lachnospiraceae bacterium]|nr:TlyA family RNA methyltransferase [Lachnospiraceae bacterium]